MLDMDAIRTAIVSGLKEYLGIPVIRANTTGKLPKYPFVSYTIRQLMNDRKGTWGVYTDGKDRIPTTQIWSVTIQSDDYSESVLYTGKAHNYFTRIGIQELKNNNIVVESVGSVTNRDTLITTDYEYRNGFDVSFGLMNEVDGIAERIGYIETVETTFTEEQEG